MNNSNFKNALWYSEIPVQFLKDLFACVIPYEVYTDTSMGFFLKCLPMTVLFPPHIIINAPSSSLTGTENLPFSPRTNYESTCPGLQHSLHTSRPDLSPLTHDPSVEWEHTGASERDPPAHHPTASGFAFLTGNDQVDHQLMGGKGQDLTLSLGQNRE